MRESKAATTRTVLVTTLLLLVAALTGASLFIVWHRMRQQVTADFSQELNRSAQAFQSAEEERLDGLRREDQLLADLPSLKALMTTNDDRTIQDGAVEFWRTSGNDLFALAGRDLHVRAAYVTNRRVAEPFYQDLSEALQTPTREYLLSGGHLIRYAVAPIYFGDALSGTLLGYVVSGYAIDAAYLTRFGGQVEANRAFLHDGGVLASSLPLSSPEEAMPLRAVSSSRAEALSLRGERYLAVSRDLSTQSNAPLRLVLFKSLRGPEREIHEISRLLLFVGIGILLIGSAVMVGVARRLTGPLENLTRRVRTFGSDQARMPAPREGTREVLQLSADFDAMQERVEQLNRSRLESERLATIGSMATSVSHDLRHYLASIYANAEFLAAADSSERERAEFLEDIRTAVMGTTEMLESLMIFGRTGQSVRHSPEQLDLLARQAVAQVRTHPEAAGVTLSLVVHPDGCGVIADGKQVERAVYNLLLNACQSARSMQDQARVVVEVVAMEGTASVRVTDNGTGVPSTLEKTLFDPFVSAGKQNGTGLGLTLCRCIAEEHGGNVSLVSSAPGATVFVLTLPRFTGRELKQESAKLQVGGTG